MFLDAQQRQVLALAVHVHKQFAQFAQHVLPDGAPVDATQRPPIQTHLATEQQLAGLVGFKPLFRQNGVDVLADALIKMEHAFDQGALGACAHKARVGAVAKQQRYRVDDDALSGAGLTSDDVEAVCKLDVERVDDRKVADT